MVSGIGKNINKTVASGVSDDKIKILKQRAEVLGKISKQENTETEPVSGIEFLLGEEHYFIESEYTGEVAHLKELTPVPGLPAYILGIFNLRGKILAVFNLKTFLNIPEKAITNHNRIITIKHGETEFGILADEILGNREIDTAQVQAKITGINEDQNKVIKGVTKDNLIILAMEKFMADSRIIINQKI